MTVNERFDLIIKHLSNGNKRAFSKSIGVAPTVIENIVGTRKGNPSFEVLQKIAFAFENINIEWLLIGKGNMIISAESQNLNILNEPHELYKKCRLCEEKELRIQEKELRIQELKETISILKGDCKSKRHSA